MVEFVFLKRALVTEDLKGKEFNGGRLLGHEGEGKERGGIDAGKGGRKNWEELSPWRGLTVAVAESGRESVD